MNEAIKVHVVRKGSRKNLTMRYIDPLTNRAVTRSAGTHLRRDAERAAAKWEAELREGRYAADSRMPWQDFIDLYDEQKLSSLSDAAVESRYTAINHLKRICNPTKLGAVTTQTLARFQSELRKEGKRETTIASYLGELQAVFNWAQQQKLIAAAPTIDKPKRAKGVKGKTMRGRPITTEEYERMLQAVPAARKREPEKWKRLLKGLWYSGLRLGEALALSWDEDAALCVRLDGKYPKLRLYAEGHKAHRDQLLPIAPEFAEMLLAVPFEDRRGLVFGIYSSDGISPLSTKRAGRYVSTIGVKAGVVTNKAAGEYATAHDLRRAFGTRWSRKVMPATLKALMRHQTIETTMQFYVDRDADDVAEEVWNSLGSTLGSTPAKPAPDSEVAALADCEKPLENKA